MNDLEEYSTISDFQRRYPNIARNEDSIRWKIRHRHENGVTISNRTDGRAIAEETRVAFAGPEARRGPKLWHWILIVSLLVPGLVAPFGTTILGVIAISDIRPAGGRIVGRPLAVFDALFYPLLLLDIAVIFIAGTVTAAIFMLIGRFLGAGCVSAPRVAK